MKSGRRRFWALLAMVLLAGCAAQGQRGGQESLLRRLRSPDPALRRAALKRLVPGPAGSPVRGAVEAILGTDVDPATRALAVEALARGEGESSVGRLREAATGDTSWMVRRRALRALVSVLGPRAAADLKRAMRDDPHPTVRVAAVELAVRTLEPADAARLVVEALRDPSPPVRLAAYHRLRLMVGALEVPPDDYGRWKQAVEQATELRDLRGR